MMKRTMIYFTGVYDTLDLFTEELKNAFETMGHQSFVYDARSERQSKEALLALLIDGQKASGGAFACVTFNNLGYNLDLADGRNLWEAYQVPYINIRWIIRFTMRSRCGARQRLRPCSAPTATM